MKLCVRNIKRQRRQRNTEEPALKEMIGPRITEKDLRFRKAK
jgi:hypothetical protein